MSMILALAIVLVLSTVIVGVYAIYNRSNGRKIRRFLGISISTFFVLIFATTISLFFGSPVLAASTEAVASSGDGLKYIAAALSTGVACIGAGIAVGISGSAAIGAISENEKLLGKTIIFVGLAEGIAIYGLIISIMILGQ